MTAQSRQSAAPHCWIFDLDGTLTLPQHDFDAIRSALGIPRGEPILEYLATLPTSDAAILSARLDDMEAELANASLPQPGCAELLHDLADAGHRLGILTRNTRLNALRCLERLSVAHLFEPDCVLGRAEAPPKPDPGGILQLLARWRATPMTATMVGDFRFDLEAGRRAGVATVHFDPSAAFAWPELTDRCIRCLTELSPLAAGRKINGAQTGENHG